MTTINFRQQSAQQIDNEKIKLEASAVAELKRIFGNIAADAENLYRIQGNINSQELADNYKPEILKAIRDAYRKTIRKFGFSLRKTIEKKHALFFDAENKAKIFNFAIEENIHIKQLVTIEDENASEKFEEINNQFLLESSLFVANESEAQNDIIAETNTKMIDSAVAAGVTAFALSQQEASEDIRKLEARLFNVEDPKERRAIARQIDAANRQIELANSNRQAIVAKNIKQNILNVRDARSTIIAGQNVGLAEAWSRQKEAELIDDAGLIAGAGQLIVVKIWTSILDGSTRVGRFNHVEPDGQTRRVNEDFEVSGERLKNPRDPRASMGNIARCRCIASYEVMTLSEFLRLF